MIDTKNSFTSIEYGGTIAHIMELLNKYTLTDFSDIVIKPTWLSKEAREQFKGCSTIAGNFEEFSNAFYIITDNKTLIDKFKPFFKGKVYERYDAEKKRYIKSC